MKKMICTMMMLMFLAGCVVVREGHIPPGQIKKQTAPGQMKKW